MTRTANRHALSSEWRFLLAVLRVAIDPVQRDIAVADDIDWERFVALAARHRLVSFLYRRAAASLTAHAPAPICLQLKALATANAQRALARLVDQIRLMTLLQGEGIPVLGVKGLVLGQELYGRLDVRHVGDIDLLVRPADAERADAILQDHGLHRTAPDFPLTPLQQARYVRLKPEFEYRGHSLRVDLIWRLDGVPETQDPWAGARPVTVGGYSMLTLAPDVNALYLLHHGARHGWFRLFWLVDAALLMRQSQVDWFALIEHARSRSAGRPLLQAADLAGELFGVELPEALRPAPSERRAVAAIVAGARRQMARRVAEPEPVLEWSRQVAYRVRLQETLADKLTVLAPHLLSPLTWRAWPLPDRWFFLYYVATPWLWLWRRLATRNAGVGPRVLRPEPEDPHAR